MRPLDIVNARKNGSTFSEIARVFGQTEAQVRTVIISHKATEVPAEDMKKESKPPEASLTLRNDPVAEINKLHHQLNDIARTAVEKAIRIGELLSEQRARCKHGEWLAWLKANVEFSQQTASRYQRLYDERDKLLTVSNLNDAYRIALPTAKRDKGQSTKQSKPKSAKRKQFELVVEMSIGTCTIKNPLPGWRVIDWADSDNAQVIMCDTCNSYSMGAQRLGVEEWHYQCRCKNSHRDTLFERKRR